MRPRQPGSQASAGRTVDVYVITLDETEPSRLLELLSPGERRRAENMRVARQRRTFVACRAALREILASHTGRDAGSLRIETEPRGKPLLAGGPPFNVSHSRDVGLVAVADGSCRLGVDVEFIRGDRPVEPLTERVFSPREQEALAGLGGCRLIEAFHWCWTAKEAFAKAQGSGLPLSPASFETPIDSARLVSADGVDARAYPWALKHLHIEKRYAASLVVLGPPCHVRVQRWSAVRRTVPGSPSRDTGDRLTSSSSQR